MKSLAKCLQNLPLCRTFTRKQKQIYGLYGSKPKAHSHIIIFKLKPSFIISLLRNSLFSPSPLFIGRMVHSYVLKSGVAPNHLLLMNNLLHFYSSCFSFLDVTHLFDEMPQRDVVSWNTMISGSAGSGGLIDGFLFYLRMKCEGVAPSQSTFVSVAVALAEMGTLEDSRQIHGDCLKYGFHRDLVVGNSLLSAYVKLGDTNEATQLFYGMHEFDQVSVEILMRGYLQQGVPSCEAFELFRYSVSSRVPFSVFALSSLLSLASTVGDICRGIQVHGYVTKDGSITDVSVVNSLVTMYARSYHLESAVCLFNEATSHDTVTWNSLIAGYAFNKLGDIGLRFVGTFMSSGMRMNESTFSSFLSCCTTLTCLENAKKAHVLITKLRQCKGLGTDNIILTMYCRCRSLNHATHVYNTIVERDVLSYNLMIQLFRSHALYKESLRVLHQIQLEAFKGDEFVYSNLVSSCSRLGDYRVGQQIHGSIVKTGFDMIVHLGNSLLEMYSQCGGQKDMEKLFCEIGVPDIFTWNILIMGYTNFGLYEQSIKIWREMRESFVEFNEFSYCAMVDICSYIKAPLMGDQIHARIKKSGLVFDTALMNSVITMYSSCGMMEKASLIFQEISSIDSVSWNAMICGYAQNDLIEESFKFYKLMYSSGLKPNNLTFGSIFGYCADHSKLLVGLQFHAEVAKTGFESDVTVANSLITMYAKCGEIGESTKIFRYTSNRDIITWNSMICAFAHHGCGTQALDTILEMKIWGERLNDVTFVGVLSACGHAGLVLEACTLFNSMFQEHGIVPSEEHYACMVDIFCRAGRLQDAKGLIKSMPYTNCSLIWRTFLSACRTNDNIELGKEAAEQLMKLEPNDSSAYVLLSNIYASADKMEEKAETRKEMGFRSVKKDSGYSWICG